MGAEKKRATEKAIRRQKVRDWAYEQGVLPPSPLSFEEMVGGLLATKPPKKKAKKASKK